MKRKIVKHGPSSLTLSLPMKWIKKNHLKKGDEVDLEVKDKEIVVSTGKTKTLKRIKIDVSDLGQMTYRIIGACYRAGYEEIEVKYKDSSELNFIIDEVEKACPGYDISDYSENRVIIKSLSIPNQEEFNRIFRKILYLIKDIGGSLVKYVKSNNLNKLNELIIKDRTLDKYSNFCRRLLNQGISTEFSSTKIIYSIIEDLEIIGDCYKKISQDLLDLKKKSSPILLRVIQKNNTQIHIINEIIFGFKELDLKKVEMIYKTYREIKMELKEAVNKISKEEMLLFSSIKQLSKITFETKSAFLAEIIGRGVKDDITE